MKTFALAAALAISSFYGNADRITVEARQESKSPATGRGAEIDRLRAVVRDERVRRQNPKLAIAAINRLGELKAELAIGDLISILTFRQQFSEEQEEISIVTDGQRYPAINALWQIGKPALPALSAVIASNVSQSTSAKNAVYTVMLIFRDDPKQSVDYLEDQATKARNQVVASRFRAAAEWTRRIVTPH
jgi:hypothetical protein